MAHSDVPGSKGPALPVSELTGVEGDRAVDLYDDSTTLKVESGQKRLLFPPGRSAPLEKKSRSNISDCLFKRLQSLDSYRCYIPIPGAIPESHEDYHEFALGPEYSIQLLGKDVPSWAKKPWLRFRTREAWVAYLISCVATSFKAEVAEFFVAKVRAKIQDAIDKTRHSYLNERLSASSPRGVRCEMPPVIDVEVIFNDFYHPLTVYNDKNTLALFLDERFATFMRKVLVPMAVQSCREVMPNIPDKVIWDAAEQMWVIQVLEPQMAFEPSQFKVYDFADKLRLYQQAMHVWNKVDGSNRLRIPAKRLLEHTSGPYSADSEKLLEATLICATRPDRLQFTRGLA